MFARALIYCIRLYQRLSRLTPQTCRFTPTCSEYTIRAVELHGLWRGIAMGIARIVRCNPFNPGGYDPVPGDPKARPDEHYLKTNTESNHNETER